MAEEQKEEKQQPVKPEKKSKGLSMPVILGIGVGGVVIILVAAFFIFKILVNDIVDKKISNLEVQTEEVEGEEDKEKEHSDDEHKDSKEGSKLSDEELEHQWEQMEEADFFAEEDAQVHQTGRIITNPKNSSSFAVVDLALYYRLAPHGEEEGGDDHSEDGEGIPKQIKKLGPRIKGTVNNFIGSKTEQELHDIRPILSEKFKEELTPVFKKNRVFLKDVEVTEFLIQ